MQVPDDRLRSGAGQSAQRPVSYADSDFSRGRRGHRLRALCPGPQRPRRDRRSALLRRHQARRLRHAAGQGPARRRRWRSMATARAPIPVFRNALGMLSTTKDEGEWRADYGSRLRDAAALLTLAAETGTGAVDTPRTGQAATGCTGAPPRYTSTQDQAWLLLAAHALMKGADQAELTLDGTPMKGALYRRLDAAALAAQPLVIANAGARPVDALLTVTGVPLTPEPAGGKRLPDRARLLRSGRTAGPAVRRRTGRPTGRGHHRDRRQAARQARLIVNDPLPAGFEIDNPHLIKAGDIADIPWLGLEEAGGAHRVPRRPLRRRRRSRRRRQAAIPARLPAARRLARRLRPPGGDGGGHVSPATARLDGNRDSGGA